MQTLHDMRLMEEGWARCSRVKFVQVRRKRFHVPEALPIESATVYELLVMNAQMMLLAACHTPLSCTTLA